MRTTILRWLSIVLLLLGTVSASAATVACIIPCYPDIMFWSDIESGMKEAAEALGMDLMMLYTRHTDSSLALSLDDALSIAIYSDVDGIITSYTLADDATDALLSMAHSSGIPVVMIDCDCPEGLRSAYVGIDNETIGQTMSERACSCLEAGECVLLVYTPPSTKQENLSKRLTGIRSVFEAHKGQLSEYPMDDFSVQSVLALRQRIDDDPSIVSVIAFNENSTLLCARALSGAARGQDVRLYGFDESAATLKLLAEGAIEALACQPNRQMGAKSVETALELIEGGKNVESIQLIDCTIRERQTEN